MKLKRVTLLIIALMLSAVAGAIALSLKDEAISPPAPNTNNAVEQPPLAATAFDKKKLSLDEPSSFWVLVNKKRPLPSSYQPMLVSIGDSQLRAEATQATKQLLAAANKEQVPLKIISGFRSYAMQGNLYANYVQRDGQAAADTYSARPGHSEHQTGLAADLGNQNGSCDLETCFATTLGGKWLAAHAHEHGFIIRYTETTTAITGYQYEPWHIRYVGTDLAKEMQSSNQVMESFFDLPPAPNY